MKNARILIVEDESIVALDIKRRLTSLGYIIVGQASSGEDAIRLAIQTKPDLILMDIKIKGPLDGIEASEQIRSQQDVPIIFLTAFADENTLQRARITGPSGYILKPFQERELAISIDMALYKYEMEKALRESEERYMLAIQGANDGIWDWDLLQNRLYYSPRWKEMFGYQEAEVGSSLDDWMRIVHPEDRELLQLALAHHLDGLTDHLECEQRMLHKDGSIRWVRTRAKAITNGNQRPHRMAGSLSDITSLRLAQEQLMFDAYHDALTSLPNRALFLDRLGHAMERRKRYHEDSLSVLFLDLDQFKVINDCLGHLAGDQLLTTIAQRLQQLVRSSDTVARLGGDEFVFLLESANTVAYARNVAERIMEVVKSPIHLEDHEIFITASIGIVMVTDDHGQASDVLRDADIAMYRAKSLGKNRFDVFDVHYRHQAAERLNIENRLMGALERKEFQIHYQPIYSLSTHQIIGVEALLRLYPHGGDPIPPAVFIPIAEEIGLIKQIGDWVLLESCQKMSDWHRLFPNEPPLNLHVNVSVKQFSPQFVDRVQEILRITQLEPSKLKLEITESIFMANIDQVALIMEQLSAIGIQLQIDDFGTGYSSLGYIRRFPIETIKLDPSFVQSLGGDNKNSEIVGAIIMLANQLGLETIAEGIETEDQEDRLLKMKCHFGQGFLFSKPLDTHKLQGLLENRAEKTRV
jgi:diguanylate cyclase (GGDEF)-like protein/PAS domain S-box-containing protein